MHCSCLRRLLRGGQRPEQRRPVRQAGAHLASVCSPERFVNLPSPNTSRLTRLVCGPDVKEVVIPSAVKALLATFLSSEVSICAAATHYPTHSLSHSLSSNSLSHSAALVLAVEQF